MTINNQLKEQGVEIVGEGGSKVAYFLGDKLIALQNTRDISIFRTDDEKVSDLYNIMLSDTSFEHYVTKGVNYITTEDNDRRLMGRDFTWRVL